MDFFRRITFFTSLFILCSFLVKAQSVTQPVEWFGTTANIKVSNRTSILAEALYRFAKDLQPMQFQARFGADIAISNKFSVMPLGYVYTWNPIYGDQPAQYVNNEHRIFQQFTFKHRSGKFSFNERLRTEERFLQRHHTESTGEVIDDGYTNQQFRIRYRFLFTFPLKGEKIEAKSWSIQFYDELFIGFGSTVSPQQPEQNRVFLGLGYQFNPALSVHAGPFYQVLIKPNGSMRENNVGSLISLVYNYDLTKDITD